MLVFYQSATHTSIQICHCVQNPFNQSVFWLRCHERFPTADFILTGYRPHTGKFQPAASPQVGYVSICKSLESQWEQAIIVKEGPGPGDQAHASKVLQPLKELCQGAQWSQRTLQDSRAFSTVPDLTEACSFYVKWQPYRTNRELNCSKNSTG